MRYLGLSTACKEQLALENRFLTHKIVELENGKIGHEILHQGQKHTLRTEQIVAFFLTRIHKFYQNADIDCKDYVITVPSYYSNVER
jgi:molecular chaperone DnaK (HSP70)